MAKLRKYQTPIILLPIGIFLSLCIGSAHVVTGYVFANMMGLLGLPPQFFEILYPNEPGTWKEIMERKVEIQALTMGSMAICLFGAYYFAKRAYSTLGVNCTLRIRKDLYTAILMKNIGWFDHPENGVSVVTSAMAADAQVVNGTATESFAPQVEGAASLIVGIAVAFYFCW